MSADNTNSFHSNVCLNELICSQKENGSLNYHEDKQCGSTPKLSVSEDLIFSDRDSVSQTDRNNASKENDHSKYDTSAEIIVSPPHVPYSASRDYNLCVDGHSAGYLNKVDAINSDDFTMFKYFAEDSRTIQRLNLSILIKESSAILNLPQYRKWPHPFITFDSNVNEYIFKVCNSSENLRRVPDVRYLSIELLNRTLRGYCTMSGQLHDIFMYEILKPENINKLIFILIQCINTAAKFVIGFKVFEINDLLTIIQQDYDFTIDFESLLRVEKEVLIYSEFDFHKPTVYTYTVAILKLTDLETIVAETNFPFFLLLLVDFFYLNCRQVFDRMYESKSLEYSDKFVCWLVECNKPLIAASIILTSGVLFLRSNDTNINMKKLSLQLATLANSQECLIIALSNSMIELIVI